MNFKTLKYNLITSYSEGKNCSFIILENYIRISLLFDRNHFKLILKWGCNHNDERIQWAAI